MSDKLNVIIPAHNEEKVINRCLHSIFDQIDLQELRIAVVCNGCSDRTFDIARSFQSLLENRNFSLTVVNIEQRSKSSALNYGDSLFTEGHRVYLDADVWLSPNALSNIQKTLSTDPVHFCAPVIVVSRAKSWITRSYARVWSALPAVRSDVIGAGLYAVSASGRKRWGMFPDIISDDKFARLHFSDTERCVIQSTSFRVDLPEGLRELILVRGRWCRGNRDLKRIFPNLTRYEKSRFRRTIRWLAFNPRMWKDSYIFLAVFLAGEIMALRRIRLGATVWERAERSRPSDKVGQVNQE